MSNYQKYILLAISILFIYAALTKLLTHSAFLFQLSQSPLIPPSLIGFTSVFVPGLELILVVMLYFKRTYLFALYALFFLLFLFTAYIVLLLTIDENAPCSCGGILNNLSFEAHIVFNVLFLALIGYNISSNPKETSVK